jgi:hypothetical protein
MIAASAATAMTTSICRSSREARMPAVKMAVSPGTGIPIVSIATRRNSTG